jgi:hypothetical protein
MSLALETSHSTSNLSRIIVISRNYTVETILAQKLRRFDSLRNSDHVFPVFALVHIEDAIDGT